MPKKYTNFTKKLSTAEVTLVYPRVTEPDYKYKKQTGEYSTKFKFVNEADEVDFLEVVSEMHAKSIEVELQKRAERDKKTIPKSKQKLYDPPWSAEIDDETDEETGHILFNCKLPGSKPVWKGGERIKVGEDDEGQPIWKQEKLAVKIVDGRKQEFPKGVEIWGGTRAKLGLFGEYWHNDGKLGSGFRLKLVVLQVLNLVTRGEVSADDFDLDDDGADYSKTGKETSGDDEPEERETSNEPVDDADDDF